MRAALVSVRSMNRRARKRRAHASPTCPLALAAAYHLAQTNPDFGISDHERFVFLRSTGKKFWVNDTKSISEFIKGSTYNRRSAAKASIPDADVQVASDHTIPVTWVRVTEAVADRVLPIALALFKQVILSNICKFSFDALATAIYKVRSKLPASVLGSRGAVGGIQLGQAHWL